MEPFAGCEPLVGEIVGLRTFRVDESGLLLPLYTNQAWYDGTNTACCEPPTGDRPRPHRVVDAGCECGFYAYGTVQAAARNRNMRYVQAVVSCWGTVAAGSQGVRAEHARIDALWLGPGIRRDLRARVAARYPSARMYADPADMLAARPLSALECYEPPPRQHVTSRLGSVLLGAFVFALGLLPSTWLSGPIWTVWVATIVATAALVLWLAVGARGTGHLAAAAVTAGVLAWLAAPMFGMAGWLLRVPVLRALAVAVGGYLLSLRPGYFPVVKTVRERAFCGVRP